MTPNTATQLDRLLNEAEKLLTAENKELKKAIRDQKRENDRTRVAIMQGARYKIMWNSLLHMLSHVAYTTVFLVFCFASGFASGALIGTIVSKILF
ncbi:unnamed protein product [Caenorhabditis nigoni]